MADASTSDGAREQLARAHGGTGAPDLRPGPRVPPVARASGSQGRRAGPTLPGIRQPRPEERSVSRRSRRPLFAVVPLAVSATLVLGACGGGSDEDNAAQQATGATADT